MQRRMAQIERKTNRYPSDLTDVEWEKHHIDDTYDQAQPIDQPSSTY
jgi:hypothetical protein